MSEISRAAAGAGCGDSVSTIESVILRLLWLQRPSYVIASCSFNRFSNVFHRRAPKLLQIEKRNDFVEQKIEGRQHEEEQGYSRDGHPRNKSDRSFCFSLFSLQLFVRCNVGDRDDQLTVN